jgi:hypothetical protein
MLPSEATLALFVLHSPKNFRAEGERLPKAGFETDERLEHSNPPIRNHHDASHVVVNAFEIVARPVALLPALCPT